MAQPAQAQTVQFDIRGVVVDSAGAGLEGAMVVALSLPDSVLTKFDLTDGDGEFTLSRVPVGAYTLQVTRVGYQTVRSDVAVADGDVDAGAVSLSILAVEMDPLVVSVDHIPFVNKGDTLDYNVLAFPTPPNASVEDLLRRLPGIEVEADGSIKALGEEVRNVLVDGKEFFGSDPTIATKGLPADAIERVAVYDKQSDLAEFTGVPDGQEERTIDLRLREDAKQGYFGRLASGLGADGGADASLASLGEGGVRYDETFGLNRFTATTQLAAIASLNNVNQAGFSWGDYQSFVGGAKTLNSRGGIQGGGGSDDGFTETLALGVNASHDFATGSWIRSSYFLSRLDNLQNRAVQQQQLLGSAVSSFGNETSNELTDNLTHRLDLTAQYTIAEGHDLRLRADLNRSASSLSSVGFQETQTPTGEILYTASTDYVVDGDDFGGNARLTWRKRLNDGGRTLVAEAWANLSGPDLFGDLTSTTELYGHGDVVTYQEIVQEQSRVGSILGQSQRLSLTQPLGRGRVLELFGQRSSVDEDQTKSIFDIEDGAPVLNELLSSEFERTYSYLRGGLRFNRNTERTLLNLGLQLQGSDLEGAVVDRNEQIANGYTHVLPSARFRYQSRPGRSVDFNYSTSTREPSMTELQPFTDNSNPVNVYVGNPDLQPEYTHGLRAEYRFFDQFSFVNLYTYVRASYTRDNIVPSRVVDEQGLQEVTVVNSDHGWSTNAGASYDTPIRPLQAKINLTYDLTYSKGSEFVNEAENRSRIMRHTVNARLENRRKDIFDLQVGGRVTLNDIEYSLNDELDQSYVNSTLFANGTYYYQDAWTFSTSFSYRLFDEDVFGPGQNVALLGATISRYVRDQRGEVQLAAVDLLDQNQGVAFTNTASLIQETRTESLGRHIMLRFVYRMGLRGR